jgi:surfactin synthase thioesterase subunit
VVRFRHRPQARLRLFCVPYAGGGGSTYAAWPAGLPDDVEVCAIQLPGREGRYREPLFTDVRALTGPLCEGIAPLLDRPFALFGHSLGAAIAYEAALALVRGGGPAPAALFVSGHRAPHLPPHCRPIHHLPEGEFIDELRHLNGTPAEVFAGAELLALVLPQLRADFRMAETWEPSSTGGELACPVVALGSTEDERVSRATLEPWRAVTSGAFDVAMFAGDHFYVKTHRARLLEVLTAQLARLRR